MDLPLDPTPIVDTLRELSELVGCPGHEEEVAGYLQRRLQGAADRLRRDPLGNLVAELDAPGAPGAPGGPGARGAPARQGSQRLMLSAHMDEVGFMVNHVEPEGFLRVDALGSFDRRVLPAALLQFRADSGQLVPGVIGSVPPHVSTAEQREKIPEIRDLFVDVGAASADEVQALGLRVGSVGSFRTPFAALGARRLLGKAFDDRAACAVLVHTLLALRASREEQARAAGRGGGLPHTVLAVFSVQEEFSHLGAAVSAEALGPDLALVLETTTATDVPDTPERAVVTRLGGGPAITVADRTVVVPSSLVRRLRSAAEQAGLPWQYKKPAYGGTDAGAVQARRAGIPTGVLSVPCRYLHGPAAVLDSEDLLNTVRLLTAFCLAAE